MKKVLTLALLGSLALSAYGQGKIVFNNFVSGVTAGVNPAKVDARIYMDTVGVGTVGALNGANATLRAALLGGATDLAGAVIVPFNPAASSLGTLNLLSSGTGARAVGFRTGNAAGYVNVGTDALRDSGLAYGSSGKFQVVAWTGGFATWADAFNAWSNDSTMTIKIGASGVLTRPVSTSSTDLSTPNLQGLTSFAVVAAPEPSSLALLGLGTAALLVFRRRK